MTPLARRCPWKVAREAMTLDHISKGRLIFGAGLGWDEDPAFTAFGEATSAKIRAEMLEESLEIINGLWTKESFSFKGKHYQVNEVKFLPKPVQSPRIPIWLAGGWPRRKPFQRAAHWDGIYLMTYHQVTGKLLTPGDVREIATYIKANRENPGLYDVAVNVRLPADSKDTAEVVRLYREAGATWCIEWQSSKQSFEEFWERIRKGPPKL